MRCFSALLGPFLTRLPAALALPALRPAEGREPEALLSKRLQAQLRPLTDGSAAWRAPPAQRRRPRQQRRGAPQHASALFCEAC